jgi:hypothetical protein
VCDQLVEQALFGITRDDRGSFITTGQQLFSPGQVETALLESASVAIEAMLLQQFKRFRGRVPCEKFFAARAEDESKDRRNPG